MLIHACLVRHLNQQLDQLGFTERLSEMLLQQSQRVCTKSGVEGKGQGQGKNKNGKANGEGKNKDAGKSGGKEQAAPIMHPPATDPSPKSQDLPNWDNVVIKKALCVFLGGRFSQSKCTCNIAWNFTGAAKTFQHCRN